MPALLLPEHPAGWPEHDFEDLYAIGRAEREALQLEALRLRFAALRNKVPALQKLAEKQKVERIDTFADALPIYYDHRVLKNYPMAILENRDFPRLTHWLNKLTMHNLTKVDLSGLKTIDAWIDRLESYGLVISTSSGTTGKLSFMCRSKDEMAAWRRSWVQVNHAATGVDPHPVKLPTFSTGYRSGHQLSMKCSGLFAEEMFGGEDNYYPLYDSHMSCDLMALSGRMQAAENKGEVEKLGLDPALFEQRRRLIEQAKRRDIDVREFFDRMMTDFRGRQVRIGGLFADLFKVARAGLDRGVKCAFAPGSIVTGGGGMKGYKDAPDNWREIVMDFFGVERLATMYGYSENMGNAPMCSAGFYHVLPYTIMTLLDRNARELPREGVQTGRVATFDLLAETYWGGFISGDEATIHFDDACDCGWKGPRVENTIRRYSEMEGGDDKITCSGNQKAYDEFMDFVMEQ